MALKSAILISDVEITPGKEAEIHEEVQWLE